MKLTETPLDTQTHRHADTQTRRHADTQTHRHADTQTRRHADTQTHRHADTQTHRHADTQTRRHADTQTHVDTDRHTDRHTEMHARTHQSVHSWCLSVFHLASFWRSKRSLMCDKPIDHQCPRGAGQCQSTSPHYTPLHSHFQVISYLSDETFSHLCFRNLTK